MARQIHIRHDDDGVTRIRCIRFLAGSDMRISVEAVQGLRLSESLRPSDLSTEALVRLTQGEIGRFWFRRRERRLYRQAIRRAA